MDEICRRLDGLPLAIELAAARLRLLTARQIADRLDDRFRLLTSGSRTVLPRQQTLRAVVDWSWDLLDERERTVLREVSVFAGGWDLAAAEAVCTGPAADLIGALVDKSLIVATPYDGDEAAGRRGRAACGTACWRRSTSTPPSAPPRSPSCVPRPSGAIARGCARWSRRPSRCCAPPSNCRGSRRLEAELDNIRAAVYRAVVAGDEEEAGALVLAMGWFWWLRNFRREGAEWTDLVLRLCTVSDDGAAPDPGRCDARVPLATPARTHPSPIWPTSTRWRPSSTAPAPDHDERHPLYVMRMRLRMLYLFMTVETDPLAGQEDERTQEYIARCGPSSQKGGPEAARIPGIIWPMTAYFMGSAEDLRPAMDAAVANCRAYGGEWEIGFTLMFRTHMVVDAPGGMQGVDDDLAELRVLSRRVGDRWMRALVCSAAGEAAMARSLFDEAKGEYEEALRLAFEVGAYAETPFLMARLAEIAYRTGERSRALTALDEASAASDRYGVADARAFVLMLRAHMALDDGEFAVARELCEQARVESSRGTPPPQFVAALDWVDALITAAESRPGARSAEAVRRACWRRWPDAAPMWCWPASSTAPRAFSPSWATIRARPVCSASARGGVAAIPGPPGAYGGRAHGGRRDRGPRPRRATSPSAPRVRTSPGTTPCGTWPRR